jgi:transposase-like protein
VGDIDLLIPKLRSGSSLPSILEPRRRVDQVLYAVVMEAYVAGVSTRKLCPGGRSRVTERDLEFPCEPHLR